MQGEKKTVNGKGMYQYYGMIIPARGEGHPREDHFEDNYENVSRCMLPCKKNRNDVSIF